jgi:hypothetical protein
MEQKINELSQKTQNDAMDVDGELMTYSELVLRFFDLFDQEEERETFYKEVLQLCSQTGPNPTTPTLQTEAKKLEDALKQRCKDIPAGYSFIMAVDEVHVLYDPRPIDSKTDHNLFSRFKSVLSEITGYKFCTVVLSTATSINGLASSKKAAPSLRERISDMELPVQFTELPFDVFLIKEPLQEQKLNLTSVGTLEFTAKFGRPL